MKDAFDTRRAEMLAETQRPLGIAEGELRRAIHYRRFGNAARGDEAGRVVHHFHARR